MNFAQMLTGLLLVVRKSLRQHALTTFVTILSVALASGLVMSVFAIDRQTYRAFTGGPYGFDAVLGARGSQLQLVLNSVFHLETSPGNIPWKLFQTIRQDPRIEWALPCATGDNYHGFRLVGTTDELFTKFECQPGKKLALMPGGRPFNSKNREAVIGSFAAQQTGLGVNSKFNPYCGLSTDESARHSETYTVVGVLEPTNTPADRVIWIPIEGIYRMSGHVLRGGGDEYQAEAGKTIDDEHKEVSAVILKLKNTQAGFALEQTINKQGKVATFAWPIGQIMADLFSKMGWMSQILTLVAYVVMLVSAGSILAAIHNSMNERRREFAILRALGASRKTVFSAILLEATAISFIGSLLGFAVYAGILTLAAHIIRAQTGVVVDVFAFHPAHLLAPMGMILLGAVSGVIPAVKAYSTDVSSGLTAST